MSLPCTYSVTHTWLKILKSQRDFLGHRVTAEKFPSIRKPNIPGYNKRVWFSIRAIPNIIALKNLTEHYIFTYDSNDKMSIVHREVTDLPNMEFLIHDSVLH